MDKFDVSALTKAVHDLWTFVAPPIWLLMISGALFAFINRVKVKSVLEEVRSRAAKGVDTAIRTTQDEKKGFAWVLIVLFCFFSVLYIWSAIVRTVGGGLPPQMVTFDGPFMSSHLQQDDLLLLHDAHPQARTISELFADIRASEPQRPTDYWQDQAGEWAGHLNTIKFLFVFVIACSFARHFVTRLRPVLRPSFQRLVYAEIAIVACGIICIGVYLYALDQQGYQLASRARTQSRHAAQPPPGAVDQADKKPPPREEPAPMSRAIAADNLRRLLMDYNGQVNRPWWELRFFDTYILTWANRTFIERSARPDREIDQQFIDQVVRERYPTPPAAQPAPRDEHPK